MRYALYFTPPEHHPLTRAATAWLDRDAFGGEVSAHERVGGLSPDEIAPHAISARRYGFHATLKAPFVLAEGESEASLNNALAAFAAATRPVTIDRIVLTQLDGFFALVPAVQSPALTDFAGKVVEAFDRFRALLSEADIARRNPDALKPEERANLMRWGYPYVFDAFRFHMTLTDRVEGEVARRLRGALEAHFAGLIDVPLAVDGLALFVEPEPGADFVVRSYHPLASIPPPPALRATSPVNGGRIKVAQAAPLILPCEAGGPKDDHEVVEGAKQVQSCKRRQPASGSILSK